MSKRAIQIDESLFLRSAAKAKQEGKVIHAVVEAYLRSWVGPEPEEPSPAKPPKTRIREKVYVVRPGDTLAQIALRMYGNAKKYALIARYNGITNPLLIKVGQRLRIPYRIPVQEKEATQPAGERFRFPLDKTETNYYKFGSLYAANSRWAGKPHPGVDFHEYKGADVYATGEGVVVINQQDPRGYGHYIMIEHVLTTGDKVWSLYGHLQYDDEVFTSPLVGEKVQGHDTIIGKEGDTGYAGVPHVHFEIKKTDQLGLYSMVTTYNLNDYFYDPYTFIDDPNNLYVPV